MLFLISSSPATDVQLRGASECGSRARASLPPSSVTPPVPPTAAHRESDALSVSSRCWSGDTLLSPCSECQCQKLSLLTVRCGQFTKCKLFTRVCVRMMASQPWGGEEIFSRHKESNDQTTNSVWGLLMRTQTGNGSWTLFKDLAWLHSWILKQQIRQICAETFEKLD